MIVLFESLSKKTDFNNDILETKLCQIELSFAQVIEKFENRINDHLKKND